MGVSRPLVDCTLVVRSSEKSSVLSHRRGKLYKTRRHGVPNQPATLLAWGPNSDFQNVCFPG